MERCHIVEKKGEGIIVFNAFSNCVSTFDNEDFAAQYLANTIIGSRNFAVKFNNTPEGEEEKFLDKVLQFID